jgi:hypothetical protein
VTSSNIRPFVRGIVERFRAQDAGALAGRDPSPRPPEDSQQHLVWVSPAANRRQRAETARKVAVKPRKIR